jgi:uncharacterized protein YcaQ
MALAASGFDKPRPHRVTATAVARTIRRLGLLQLDFVNVLIPAHYLVLFSRLGAYDRALFHQVAYGGREFTEHWAHEASLIPMETWPLLRHRMARHRPRPYPFSEYMQKNPEYVEWALQQVVERGPLVAADLARGKTVSLGHDWFTTVERAVLEAHFGYGRLAVTTRSERFVRSYDLTERVLSAEVCGRVVDRADAERELIRIAARACGIAAAGDLADYFRMPLKGARARIVELLDAGELVTCQVEGWSVPAYLWKDAAVPRKVTGASLLSPFDPLVWSRPRVARLFEFDYRLEIYVPPGKRRWGYYVLPFLWGDRLVGRVDLRADRQARVLEVAGAWREGPGDGVADAMAAELYGLAKWLVLEGVRVGTRGNLARGLRAAVTSRGGLP